MLIPAGPRKVTTWMVPWFFFDDPLLQERSIEAISKTRKMCLGKHFILTDAFGDPSKIITLTDPAYILCQMPAIKLIKSFEKNKFGINLA